MLAEEGGEVLGVEPLHVTAAASCYGRNGLDHQHVTAVLQRAVLVHEVVVRIDAQRQRVVHVIERHAVHTAQELAHRLRHVLLPAERRQERNRYASLETAKPTLSLEPTAIEQLQEENARHVRVVGYD